MAIGLPPPPVNDQPGSFTWLEWYRQLRNYVSTSGSVPWFIINFAGSNITDIAARDHGNLQGLQGGGAGERYHLTLNQSNRISNHINLVVTSSGIVLPTTPTIFQPSGTVTNSGITYDSSTGIWTFLNGGSYSLTFMLDATASAANKTIYFYVDFDTGSGFVTQRYTARSRLLAFTTEEQTLFTSSNYFEAGTKLRFYLWSNSATVTLNSTDVPGTPAGTVTIPACRISWEGGL